MNHPAPWTPSDIAELRKLLDEKLSASQIGKQLGFSRNAVIGKVHRMQARGEAMKFARVQGQNEKPARKAPKFKPNPKSPAKLRLCHPLATRGAIKRGTHSEAVNAPLAPRLISLLELREGDCKFPIGDLRKAGFGFCGHPSLPFKPYCAEHSAVAYQVEHRRRASGTNRNLSGVPDVGRSEVAAGKATARDGKNAGGVNSQ